MVERACLVLSCTRDGKIAEILRDDFAIARTDASFAEIVDSGSMSKAEGLIAALTSQGSVAGWHVNMPLPNGVHALSFSGALIGESLLIVGASANESRDNQIYEELSRLNNELINRERELARKTAALVRIAAEKERMVAIAAHDLRNPLTVVSFYADLLKMDAVLDDEHQLFVEEIGRSSRFMMELVEEMLDASRLESGHVDLNLQEIDLVTAASHAATINRMRAERKQIAVAFETEIERAPLRADPVKLRQIINNLVVNAIKFSPPGTIVTVRTRRIENRAAVEVEDQGIGIPLEKQTAIFEPFKTLVASGTAGEKSTGLGLAIVKQLADLHGATVEVESCEGRGSLFRVLFRGEW